MSRLERIKLYKGKLVHGHKFWVDSELRTVLINDNITEFIKKYDAYLSSYIKLSWLCRKYCKCRKTDPCVFILKYNTGKIFNHVMKTKGIGIGAIYALLKKVIDADNRDDKDNNLINSFMSSFLYANLTDAGIKYLYKKVLYSQNIRLIELFHMRFGKFDDIGKCIKGKYNILITSRILRHGYTITDDMVLDLIINNNSIDYVDLLLCGITEGRIRKIINDPKNKNKLNRIYGTHTLKSIELLEMFGLEINISCLGHAIDHLQMLNVEYILDKFKDMKLTDKMFETLLSQKGRQTMDIINNFIKHPEYEKIIIKIISNHLTDVQKDRLAKNPKKFVQLMFESYYFDAYHQLEISVDINSFSNKRLIDYVIYKLIKADDVDKLKQIFDKEILLPIDVSMNKTFMDNALRTNSHKMINYLHNDLKMVCNYSSVVSTIKLLGRHYRKNELSKYISSLNMIDVPITDEIILMICRKGLFENVMQIMQNKCKYNEEKDAEMIQKLFAYGLLYNEKKFIKFLEIKGYTINIKNMIDRMITLCKLSYGYNRRHSWYFLRYGHSLFDKITIPVIKRLTDYGWIVTKKSVDKLLLGNKINVVIYLHKTLKLVPSFQAFTKLLSVTNVQVLYDIDVNTIKYLNEEMNTQFIEKCNGEMIFNNSIYNKCYLWNKTTMPTLKYILEKINYKNKLNKLSDCVLRNRRSIRYLHLYCHLGGMPTKQMLLSRIYNSDSESVRYIINANHKISLTLNDIHKVINRTRHVKILKLLQEKFGIIYSVETIRLITKSGRGNKILPFLIQATNGEMTQNIADDIKIKYPKIYATFQDKIKIIEQKEIHDELDSNIIDNVHNDINNDSIMITG